MAYEVKGGRRVTAIVLTHGHNDHINAPVALGEATGAPICPRLTAICRPSRPARRVTTWR
jgi:glyoxylase-like metal-dependent hydrolase (beta-lactamase superfamily II)